MRRYDTRIEDGTLSIETDDGWLRVGAMDDVVDVVGGETYAIEYDEDQRTVDWVDADDGTMTFDVREVIAGMTYDDTFVETVADAPIDETNEDGIPVRTATFATLMRQIWDSKGNLEDA